MDLAPYEPIFYPKSLAVIGASNSPMKFGGLFLSALLTYGFKGKIYPINPREKTIQGLTAYASLDSVPDPVDFAAITVPASEVLAAVRACIRKGVKGAEILTAGFREAGPEGAARERELAAEARAGGLRLIGPNGFGLYTPAAGLTLMPGMDFSPTPGPVGFISQSGGGACDMAYMAWGRGVHFSTMVSYGNGCDLAATELLRFFQHDPRTQIVGAYLEGVDDGREFLAALRELATVKPVAILKGGLSDQGHRGTMGHTGSLAGSRAGWNAAIKSANAIPARDLRDLADLLMALVCLDGFTGGRVGILAGGGLRTVDGLDAASEFGFPVPELDPETAAKIQAMLPPAGGRGANPVDLANPVMSPLVINPIMELLAQRPDIDFLVAYQMLFYLLNTARRTRLQSGQDIKLEYHSQIAAQAMDIRARTGKPLVMVLLDVASAPDHWEMEAGRLEARAYYTARRIPVFDTGLQAFSVLRRVSDHYLHRANSLDIQL